MSLQENMRRADGLPHEEGDVTEVRRDIAGVVLTGGLSSRMGTDKPHLRPFGQERPDMLHRTYNMLSQFLGTVWVSCRPHLIREGYDCIVDIHAGIGPLGGVHAALVRANEAGFSAILVLSCDLPCMTYECLKRLIEARCGVMTHVDDEACASYTSKDGILATVCCDASSKYLEPLIAIYEVQVLPFLEEAIVCNQRRLQRIIPQPCWHRVYFSEEEARAFFNMNTPQDLAHFHKYLKKDG